MSFPRFVASVAAERQSPQARRFYLVIPTHNSERFIDACLNSIYTQSGNFSVHVHVQDCLSTDLTTVIVKEWQQIVGDTLTLRSERDGGIYDGVLRAAKDVRSDDIMTWIGSDDIFMPGAFASVASIFSQHECIKWITGQPYVADEFGECYTPHGIQHFDRLSLTSGVFDGRRAGFIMQEGTFWRGELWTKSGGVDPNFKRAGDWDLWRRFAQHAHLYAVTFPLARFTKRDGQTSSDMSAYYAEVDAAPPIQVVYDKAAYRVMRYVGQNKWKIESTAEASDDASLRYQYDELRQQLAIMEASKSWRLTAPLRALRSISRHLPSISRRPAV